MSTLKVGAIRGVSASSDAITVASDGTCTANITNNLSNRNKVINGGMMVHQRGDAAATGSAAYLSCDRFLTNNGSGAQVAVTKSTDTPDGFSASTKWACTTADTSIAAGDYFLIQHRMEGQNLQDFAKGTSSRSTKLVHGGVRYLAQGDIALVREACRERGLLQKNARHLVKNETFVIPAYKW